MSQIRNISTQIPNFTKIVPKNLKGKSKSSQEWLIRQLADPYVEKAKLMNYRCRSVFKLLEIDDKYRILKPGNVIIDCGAAPGSWSQVAVKRSNADGSMGDKYSQGLVLSMDLLFFHPIEGATTLGGMDFTKKTSQEKLKKILDSRGVDNVLSDMAPNATGVRQLDQEIIINLCYEVLKFALLLSNQGANLLVKVWDNSDVPKLEKDMLKFYENVRRIKPKSSRSESSEQFLLARGFFGTKNENLIN